MKDVGTLAVDNSRIELKYSMDEKVMGSIDAWIRFHPAHFSPAYPDRWVNSLYFDNANLDALQDNFSGISRRIKARYRWYGDMETPDTGVLELKLKKYEIGSKEFYTPSAFTLQHGGDWRGGVKDLRDSLGDAGRVWLDRFHRPVVIVRYLRKYYLSADGVFRLTIDRKVDYFSQWSRNNINLRRGAIATNSTVVIELKFAPDALGGCTGIVDKLPARRARHSKYVWGGYLSAGL